MSRFDQRLEEARRLHSRGDVAGALRAYGELNRESPGNVAVLHPFGVALAQVGRLAEAEVHLLRAAKMAPRDASVQFDVAALRDAQGRPGDAEAILRQIVGFAPERADAWAAIGMYRRDVGDIAAAADAYGKAFAAAPDKLEYALQAAELMEPEEGAGLLIVCLERFPGEEAILLPLAELLLRAERHEEAETILRTLHSRDKSAVVGRHLGALYAQMNRIPAAAAALYDTILREPHDAEAWALLAKVRDAARDADGAAAAAARAVSLGPDNLRHVGLRARLQQHAARIGWAQADLAALPAAVRDTSDVRFLSGMLLPPILDSNAQIDALRERWMETMADIEARPTFAPEPWETVALNGYFLGYHGREDRPLMEAFARASLAASPHLQHTAARMGSGGEKLRVGFLSAHMKHHSVGRVLIRLMGALDRERFEVVLLQLPDKSSGGQEGGEAAADRTVRIPRQIDAAREVVESERVDVLLYCDLHLNPFADALSFSRLAPVQATTWGHPGTGGRPTIDYWLSCEDWEPEGNERLYTERLVRLKRPPYVFSPSEAAPAAPLGRADLRLREDARLYGSLQSLFKFHPDIDAIFASILERDPKARLVLSEGPHYTWREQLTARFARTFDTSRIDFLPYLGYTGYISAIAACDVHLDPIHFGGAITSLDVFSVGKPIVTLPGDQMRGRVTGGLYRQMGYEKPVANGPDEYVGLAVAFANDRGLAQEAKGAISAGRTALFDNLGPVEDFAEWLLGVRGRGEG